MTTHVRSSIYKYETFAVLVAIAICGSRKFRRGVLCKVQSFDVMLCFIYFYYFITKGNKIRTNVPKITNTK